MPSICRLGDSSSHGGTIITANTSVKANNKHIAVEGDLHQCLIEGHGVTPITSISQSVLVNNKKVIIVGSQAGCGAVITEGNTTVFST